MSKLKTTSIVFAFLTFLLNSCNIEPFEGEIPAPANDSGKPSSCEEAILNTAEASEDYVFANSSDSNYAELCNAYKTALEYQLELCGDEEGTLQTIIDSIDCMVQENISYSIGDVGPGGGFVFYLNGNGGGMEVAPSSTEFLTQWGCYSINAKINGTKSEFGSGKENTRLILEYHESIDFYNDPEQCQEFVDPIGIIQSTGEVAAKRCSDLDFGGYNDWYLPSLGELELIYNNLLVAGLGDFSDTRTLISSTESDTHDSAAMGMLFNDFNGNLSGDIWGFMWKYDLDSYRAVRNF